MTATCTHCQTTFFYVDRNDDDSPYFENTRCVYLCGAGCEHLFFACDGCGRPFCSEHQVAIDELALCLDCAAEAVESQEPECQCSQTDGDLFDPRSCEYHNSASAWNVRLRAFTVAQQCVSAPSDAA